MLRPPRRDKSEGSSDGLARGGKQTTTNLSNSSTHDGRHMRRRYVLFFGLGLLVVSAILASVVLFGGKNNETSGGEDGSDGDGNSIPTPIFNTDAYTVISSTPLVESHQANVELLKHTKSGMTVMTMVTSTSTNDATFGLNFRTIPDNHHGTAHIVEQALMDGSDQYPVKDVLNQLERGSLQTYIKTMTGRDRSSFLVSSRNKADFKHSMQVYLDAVFYPQFVHPQGRWIFRQEGWRLEVINKTEVIIKGYVTQSNHTVYVSIVIQVSPFTVWFLL